MPVGTRVVTSGDNTKLRQGSEILASIPKGTELMITEIRGSWLGVTGKVNGKEVSGWLQVNEVAAAGTPVPRGTSSGTEVASPVRSWVTQLASTFDDREAFDRFAARDSKGSASAMVEWKAALAGKTTEEVGALDLLTFVGRYDPLWHDDKYVPAESTKRASRISTLPKEEVLKWKSALESVHDGGVSELWTIGFVVDTDRLFAQQGFLLEESSLLLTRLKALPKTAVASLAETQNVAKAKAAMLLAAADVFFTDETFQERNFAQVLRLLKAKLAEIEK